ncbi:MAG: UbiD family decarboxylase [Deltaproteobacteria bacterium]|nr:UbiD family decarboxylase [Deltaproteobacteria bacterium]
MQQGIRDYIDRLLSARLLMSVDREVDPRLEIPAWMKATERTGKAVMFNQVKHPPFRMINNLLGSRNAAALLFGVTPEEVTRTWVERVRHPFDPKLVRSSPVKEVIKKGSEVDLETLPIVTHCLKDAGPFITAGIVIARDPDTGIRNVSVNRMQLKGRNRLGIRMMPPQHLGIIHQRSEQRGHNLEVAVAIGNHPFEFLAAAASVPFETDEFSIAGALREEPLELVKCETVDLEVPACAEIVLEGEVLAGVREPEGPFGDFMQYHVPVMDNPVFEVKAMTHRADPIYQTVQAGSLEDTHYLALSREARIYEAVAGVADVRAISLVPTILGCAISIRKRFEGEPKNVAAAAFGAYSWLKYCVVVDHDVDVFDMNDVWWAMVTRNRPDKGLLLMENALGFPRDPHDIHRSKLGIDATAPLNQWDEFERKTIPEIGEFDERDSWASLWKGSS